MNRRTLMTATAAALALTAATAQAQTTLRVGSFLSPIGVWHGPLQHLMDEVHAADIGIRMELVADPSSVSPFQLGNAVQSGVIDVAYISGAFYTNLVPESDAHKLFNIPTAEMRENGGMALIDQIHRERMNSRFLGKVVDGITYHIYTSDPVESIDLSGLRIRSTPLYRPFLTALGADNVQMAGGEVYSALEGGVIDGYPWPLWGISDLGLLDVTRYRIEPGFYNSEIGIVFNERSWDRLTPEQQDAFERIVIEVEEWFPSYLERVNAEQIALQDEAGIEAITFSEEMNAEMLRIADESAWAEVIRNSPEYGPRLRELTYRAP
ncbi:MAG: TRAP transporter substrate-binding protein DctP [Rhodobacteraceae bacterium]|nr:TRAP transporter substrate-binding protein DctP [Paracoccaceae bacterium]